jgi:isocitrate/isopropylmalate dehydrogenase
MLILLIESNDDISTDTYPNIIIHSIDNQNVFVFPKIYRISTNKVAYIYQDSNMNNKIIDNNVRFNVIHSKKSFDVYKISYRSI